MTDEIRTSITSTSSVGVLNSIRLVTIGYIFAIILAEVLVTYVDAGIGLIAHTLILGAIIFHTVFVWQSAIHQLLIPMLFVPLIRLLSVSLPLAGIDQIYWYFIVSLPLFIIAPMIIKLIGYDWKQVGFIITKSKLQFIAIGSGLVLGPIEYIILRPNPFIDDLNLSTIAIPALILLFSTGLLEELIFRGIIQQATEEALGAGKALLFSAIIFTVLHIGYQSIADLIVVFIAGMLWGYLFMKTRSIVGISIGHGITNIILFLILPVVMLAPNQSQPNEILIDNQDTVSSTSEVTESFNDITTQLLDAGTNDEKSEDPFESILAWLLICLSAFISLGGFTVLSVISDRTNTYNLSR